MSAQSVGLAHYRARQRLANAITAASARLWRQVDPADVSRSWLRLMPQLFAVLSVAQRTAAAMAPGYVADILAEQGLSAELVPVVSESLSGVASDGRPLGTLLMQPALSTLSALGSGVRTDQAMAVGSSALQLITTTQVADAGRVADGVAITGQRVETGYVRMLVGRSCSRCVILAGERYRWNSGFLRHPDCDCIHIPYREDVPDDVTTDPMAYFRSLSRAEQDRTFGKAGTQAILDGADMNQVVNARRGMYTAGGRLLTTEGTTRRGLHGGYYVDVNGRLVRREQVKITRAERKAAKKAPNEIRLMPEHIYKLAGSDREKALSLLRDNGFITDPSLRRTVLSRAELAARPADARLAAAEKDRAAWASVHAGLGRAGSLNARQRAALREYQSSFFEAINGQLRRGEVSDRVGQTVATLDQAMGVSRITRDIQVWRGVTSAERMFGDALDRDMTGLTWRELAYTSTSAAERFAQDFGIKGLGSAPVLMRIVVPKGTSALRLGTLNDQAEVLIERGKRFRVIADRGISPQGYRLLDIEVLP